MTTIKLKSHPYAKPFPLMKGDEFDDLVADIKANGQREPFTLYQGKILDGRNRYRACLAADFEPAVRNGDNWIGDPASFVIARGGRLMRSVWKHAANDSGGAPEV
jgi:hypothetical protein